LSVNYTCTEEPIGAVICLFKAKLMGLSVHSVHCIQYQHIFRNSKPSRPGSKCQLIVNSGYWAAGIQVLKIVETEIFNILLNMLHTLYIKFSSITWLGCVFERNVMALAECPSCITVHNNK